MKMHKNILVLLSTITILAACSTDALVEPDTSKEYIEAIEHSRHLSHSDYQKPGAAIDFEHNYDGYSELSEIEHIQLIFTEQYEEGVLSVRLVPQGDLSLVSNSYEESFSVLENIPLTMDVELISHIAGQHFLYVYATISHSEMELGDQTQAFAIQVNVGDIDELDQFQEEEEQKINEKKMILVPAVETVIQ